MIRYNVWSWWDFRPEISSKLNMIFLEYHNVNDLKHYCINDLRCESMKIIPVINCYASERFKGKTVEYARLKINKDMIQLKELYDAGIIHGVVLDYIRQGGYSDLKPTREDIRLINIMAKEMFKKDVYVALMMNWKSWLHGQYWRDFEGLIKMPMIYGKGFLTHFFLYFYGLFYSNIIPCIRAWDTTKEEFKAQEKILNSLGVPFSVWKIQDLKELLKR